MSLDNLSYLLLFTWAGRSPSHPTGRWNHDAVSSGVRYTCTCVHIHVRSCAYIIYVHANCYKFWFPPPFWNYDQVLPVLVTVSSGIGYPTCWQNLKSAGRTVQKLWPFGRFAPLCTVRATNRKHYPRFMTSFSVMSRGQVIKQIPLFSREFIFRKSHKIWLSYLQQFQSSEPSSALGVV
jgi:hypothetical protein